MQQFHLLAAIIGGIIVLFSFQEKRIQKGPLSEPLVAMLIGILLGPYFLGLLQPSEWNDKFLVLHIACEVTIAMALMSTALRLPTDYVRKRWQTLLTLLLLVLTLMVLFAGLSFWTFLDIPVLAALLLGAIVAPTDPVIATSIVSGPMAKKFLPSSIRNTISMESGANDGLAMPLVMLPILLLTKPTGGALSEWLLKIVLWENIGAIIIGAAIGLSAGKGITYFQQKKDLTTKGFLGFTIALGFFVLAGSELIKMNGIIAVFAAGLGMNHMVPNNDELREERVQEAVERLFTVPIFFLFGILVPIEQWVDLGWMAIVIPVVILLLRRLPALFIGRWGIKTLKSTAEFWFTGWFGPIGVAAMFYAVLAHKHLHDSIFWIWPSLLIFSSTLIHSISSGPFVKWYYRNVSGQKERS